MRTITKQELIDANRKAYREHRLIAQNLDVIGPGDPCRYVGPVLPDGKTTACAIGVVLNDSERSEVMHYGLNTCCGVNSLVHDFSVVEFEDEQFARALQTAHDNWVSNTESDGAEYIVLIGL